LGGVNDVKKVAEFVKSKCKNAEVVVDGVAYAPHRVVDVQDLGVDYYVFSWYKVYGPHVSCLYIRREASRKLSSLAHFFIPEEERPYIFQPGNLNYELTASLVGVGEYLGKVGRYVEGKEEDGEKVASVGKDGLGFTRGDLVAAYKKFEEHETFILTPLLEYLKSKKDVYKIIGRDWAGERRVPTVAFVLRPRKDDKKQLTSQEVVERMDAEGFGIRFGHFVSTSSPLL
jgi:selenocysteine lyase/cysteine desulfurase